MNDKVKLHLDVDGVVNMFPPRGRNMSGWSSISKGVAKGYTITWSPEMLAALEDLGLDLVWTTTWLDWAAEHIGSLTGFGREAPHLTPPGGKDIWFPSIDWKYLSMMEKYPTSGARFVWIDDELDFAHMAWAKSVGGLAIRTSELKGITPEDIEKISEYLKSLEAVDENPA